MLFNIFKSEEQDLIDLSDKNFKTLFKVVNTVGEESMSVGENGRLALQETLKQIFDAEVDGLEVIILNAKKSTPKPNTSSREKITSKPIRSSVS